VLTRLTGRTVRHLDHDPQGVPWTPKLTVEEARTWGWTGDTQEALDEYGAGHWRQARLGHITGTTDDVRRVTGHDPMSRIRWVPVFLIASASSGATGL
jgi:hypothetical protein